MDQGYVFADTTRDDICRWSSFANDFRWFDLQRHFVFGSGHGCVSLHPTHHAAFQESKTQAPELIWLRNAIRFVRIKCKDIKQNMSIGLHNSKDEIAFPESVLKFLESSAQNLIQLSVICSTVENVQWNEINFAPVLCSLHLLVSLRISWMNGVDFESLKEVFLSCASGLPLLRKLVLAGNVFEGDEDDLTIAEVIENDFKDLEIFGIGLCRGMNRQAIMKALSNLPNLCSVMFSPFYLEETGMKEDFVLFKELAEKHSISNYVVYLDVSMSSTQCLEFAQRLVKAALLKPKLVSLHLQSIFPFPFPFIGRIGNNLVNLELAFRNHALLADSHFQIFKELAPFVFGLRKLSIKYGTVHSDQMTQDFCNLLQIASNLEILNLEGIVVEDYRAVQLLQCVCSHPNLAQLHLFNFFITNVDRLWTQLAASVCSMELGVTHLSIGFLANQAGVLSRSMVVEAFSHQDIFGNIKCHCFDFPVINQDLFSNKDLIPNQKLWKSRNVHYHLIWIRTLLCFAFKKLSTGVSNFLERENIWMVLTFVDIFHKCDCDASIATICPSVNEVWPIEDVDFSEACDEEERTPGCLTCCTDKLFKQRMFHLICSKQNDSFQTKKYTPQKD
jgi:hypothetical protein